MHTSSSLLYSAHGIFPVAISVAKHPKPQMSAGTPHSPCITPTEDTGVRPKSRGDMAIVLGISNHVEFRVVRYTGSIASTTENKFSEVAVALPLRELQGRPNGFRVWSPSSPSPCSAPRASLRPRRKAAQSLLSGSHGGRNGCGRQINLGGSGNRNGRKTG